MSEAPLEPGVEGAPGSLPATPGQRLGGAVVDGAVLQLVGLLLLGLDRPVAAAISTAAYLAYEVSLVVVRGQTVGKIALGTAVVDTMTGRLPTTWQAATRAVVPLAGVLVDVALGIAAVGLFWVLAVYGSLLLDERRRGLHDKAAGTMVVTVERTPAHRRAGVVAVAVAVALTFVLVLVALDDLEEDQRGENQAAGPTMPPWW